MSYHQPEYTDWRIHYAYFRRIGTTAPLALKWAKQCETDGRVRYNTTTIYGNQPRNGRAFQPKWSHETWRWIEKPEACGLRFAGYADELNRSIQHTGWYTDEHGCRETVRGVVYHLPGGRAVYGIDNKCNGEAHKGGPALICVSDVYIVADSEGAIRSTGENTATHYCTELKDLASWADRAAERYAEEEREYQHAWDELGEACETVNELRDQVRDIVSDLRIARAELEAVAQIPNSCPYAYGAAISRVDTNIRGLEKAWSEYCGATSKRADLADNRHGITIADVS